MGWSDMKAERLLTVICLLSLMCSLSFAGIIRIGLIADVHYGEEDDVQWSYTQFRKELRDFPQLAVLVYQWQADDHPMASYAGSDHYDWFFHEWARAQYKGLYMMIEGKIQLRLIPAPGNQPWKKVEEDGEEMAYIRQGLDWQWRFK